MKQNLNLTVISLAGMVLSGTALAEPVQSNVEVSLLFQAEIENQPVIRGLDAVEISYSGNEELEDLAAYDDFCLYTPQADFRITATGLNSSNGGANYGLATSDDQIPLVAYNLAMTLNVNGFVGLTPGETTQVNGFTVATFDPSCVEDFMSLEITFPTGLPESLDTVTQNHLTPGVEYMFSDTVTILLEPGLG